jgi:succinate dehydrogenase hydrophobic anchor subunit
MSLEKLSQIASIAAIPLAVVAWLTSWLIDKEQAKKFIRTNFGLIIIAFLIVSIYALWARGWFSWLTYPVTWPIWAWILLGLTGLVIVMLFFFFVRLIKEQPQQPIDHLNYRTDEIFGVQWTWSFVYGMLNENNLSAFCPKKSCMCRLKCQPNQNARYNPNFDVFPISLVCPNCGFQRDFDNDLEHIKHDVLIEVERRIRTGLFRQQMEQP